MHLITGLCSAVHFGLTHINDEGMMCVGVVGGVYKKCHAIESVFVDTPSCGLGHGMNDLRERIFVLLLFNTIATVFQLYPSCDMMYESG